MFPIDLNKYHNTPLLGHVSKTAAHVASWVQWRADPTWASTSGWWRSHHSQHSPFNIQAIPQRYYMLPHTLHHGAAKTSLPLTYQWLARTTGAWIMIRRRECAISTKPDLDSAWWTLGSSKRCSELKRKIWMWEQLIDFVLYVLSEIINVTHI